MTVKPFEHQDETANFILNNDIVLNTSDPGTGKTLSHLLGFMRRRSADKSKRLLVIAPKTLLQTAWGNDIHKFTPELSYSIAWSEDRFTPFKKKPDVVLINHDGVGWLQENTHLLEGVTDLVIDESTAFKNSNAQRSKHLSKLAPRFTFRAAASGTIMPNSVLDVWHQVFILDQGARLGKSFYHFRHHVCDAVPTYGGRYTQWVDKPGIVESISSLLKDITVRYKLEDCIDIPENYKTWIEFDMPPKIRDAYCTMEHDAVVQFKSGALVNAVNAASVRTKLLQILSGAVYDENGEYHVVDSSRYELITDLIQSRQQCLVGFMWRHQRDLLTAFARKAKITHAVIDGSVPVDKRAEIVDDFQAGKYRVIYAHPQSAGHGLTLTAGKHTIWSSPTDKAEHFDQFFRRIYRNTQTDKTETVLVSANNTVESILYQQQLLPKVQRTNTFLEALRKLSTLKTTREKVH